MGTILVSTVINKAATMLYDANNVKWGRSELLQWFNDAQRSLVSLVPETSATTTNIQLVAGVRQTIPAAAWILLEATRNMGNGSTSGRLIKRVDRAMFDETNPTWASDAANAVTTMYMYNLRDRTTFYVYPAATGATYIEIVYSVNPTELTEAGTILVADIYVPALLDYIMWRAHSKDAPYASAEKAQAYMQSYTMTIRAISTDTGKLAAEMGQLAGPTTQGQGTGGGS